MFSVSMLYCANTPCFHGRYMERQVYDRAQPGAFGTRSAFNGQQHITQHFLSRHCYICGARHVEASGSSLCTVCKSRPGAALIGAMHILRQREQRVSTFRRVCSQCAHASHLGPSGVEVTCTAVACPMFFERAAAELAAQDKQTAVLHGIVRDMSGRGRSAAVSKQSFEW